MSRINKNNGACAVPKNRHTAALGEIESVKINDSRTSKVAKHTNTEYQNSIKKTTDNSKTKGTIPFPKPAYPRRPISISTDVINEKQAGSTNRNTLERKKLFDRTVSADVENNDVCFKSTSAAPGGETVDTRPDSKSERRRTYKNTQKNQEEGRVGIRYNTLGAVKHRQTSKGTSQKDSSVSTMKSRSWRDGLPAGAWIILGVYFDTEGNRQLRYGPVSRERKELSHSHADEGYEDDYDSYSAIRPSHLSTENSLDKIPQTEGNITDGLHSMDIDSGFYSVDPDDTPEDNDINLDAYVQSHSHQTANQETTSFDESEYEETRILSADLRLQGRIGNHGDMYKAKWKDTVVAVKILNDHPINPDDVSNYETDELVALKSLKHPNVVKIFGMCEKNDRLVVVMSYMEMSLYDALYARNDIEFCEMTRIDIIKQICNSLKYLHAVRIAHRNLKTSNVLLDFAANGTITVKLSDFGSVLGRHRTVTQETIPDSRAECKDSGKSFRDLKKEDIYCLSLVLFEVIYEKEPFDRDMSSRSGLQEWVEPEAPATPAVNENILDILKECWSEDPDDRPDIADVEQLFRFQRTIYLA